MLSRRECESYEAILHKEIADRQRLGGYSPDSGTLQMLCQLCFELIRHTKESLPEPATKSAKSKPGARK